MTNKAGRYLVPYTGLLFGLVLLLASSVVACGQPVPSPPSPVPPAQLPPAAEGQPPEELPPVDEAANGEEWDTVEIFTGVGNETTLPFHISGTKWRITWAIDAEYPEYAVFDLLVYPEGTHSILTKRISYSSDSARDIAYIYEGGGDYYIKVVAASLRSWTIMVEDYATKASLSPVQITRVNYKGRDYLESRKVGYEITVEDGEYVKIYPIVEADEYVEVENQSDSWQDIGGWVLKNITKGRPSFTFPSTFPGSIDYGVLPSRVHPGEIYPEYFGPPAYCVLAPHHSIRVYTGEVHPESGGFCFYYGPGDVWNNEKPDTAVLYNYLGQEVSRKSYIVTTEQ